MFRYNINFLYIIYVSCYINIQERYIQKKDVGYKLQEKSITYSDYSNY